MSTTQTAPRITNAKTAPTNRAMKKVWLLENLIHHPRTGAGEREAAERMLDRALDAARKSGEISDTSSTGKVWHGYQVPSIRYGARYEEVKHLSTTEIAKRIREDIKLARKVQAKLGGAEIALPDSLSALATMPKGMKVSVRREYYSGGSSIDVRVYNLPEQGWGYVQEKDMWGQPRWVPGGELKAILDALKEIHRAYNFDGSDAMTDYYHVNYGGHVEVDWRERPRG